MTRKLRRAASMVAQIIVISPVGLLYAVRGVGLGLVALTEWMAFERRWSLALCRVIDRIEGWERL